MASAADGRGRKDVAYDAARAGRFAPGAETRRAVHVHTGASSGQRDSDGGYPQGTGVQGGDRGAEGAAGGQGGTSERGAGSQRGKRRRRGRRCLVVVESSEDAVREKEAWKRQLAEEELRRSREEVERIQYELAGVGTVRGESGRQIHANTRQQQSGPFHWTSPGGFDSSQDIFRGDTDDARRDQRLRNVEKHVNNAIRRIVAAHGIKLPATLRQGWSSVRSGHSGDGGAWDVISRKLVGVNKSSEEDLIIR
mmetsp:Transcript_60641/g.179812  ORF Transcript_60641/g.179812 Transcript_60641/m.179812 type:complete len:252 (-) Transcript_60641:345-1100(-)